MEINEMKHITVSTNYKDGVYETYVDGQLLKTKTISELIKTLNALAEVENRCPICAREKENTELYCHICVDRYATSGNLTPELI